MRFDVAYPIHGLKPASYNPRAISEECLGVLQDSIRTLGFVKPVIVTTGNTLIAGHQRTKAASALGIERVPAVILDGRVEIQDEIRFNQLHNGTDLDAIDQAVHIISQLNMGYSEVEPGAITVGGKASGATSRSSIAQLILKYGPWGCAVVSQDGEVLSSPQYALACKSLRIPCRVYAIENSLKAYAKVAFARDYGRFSYDHIERSTYVQTFAQMYRLRGGMKENRSSLYSMHVLKSVSRSEAILDFGCGQGDYVRNLSKKGYRIFGLEFFYRDPKVNAIDAQHVHRMIDSVISHVRQYGLFDVVVCDAVLNSVDSVQAEQDVLTCLNAFCRMNGRVFISGRLIDQAERGVRAKNSKNPKRRRVEFLDSNGLTGIYRYGGWFFQKFHSPHQAKALATQYFGDETPFMTTTSTCWQIAARKQSDLPIRNCEEALSREFSLQWPGGRTVGRSEEVISAWRDCKAREAA